LLENLKINDRFHATALRVVRYREQHEEIGMDKDRIEGAGTNIKGKIKEGVGKMTGDAKTEAEGQADQVKGKAQNAVGGMKDKAREFLNGD
jgi:uncharacterized protein YjbJ (UPF0337 family)